MNIIELLFTFLIVLVLSAIATVYFTYSTSRKSYDRMKKGSLKGIRIFIIFISELSLWATIVFAMAAFYSWHEVINSKKNEYLHVPIIFSVLAVFFLILLIYNKFFRKRREGWDNG